MSDVHIPGIGNVSKPWAIAGAGITIGIVGIAWWRHKSTASADAAAATVPASDASAADPVDPNTGIPYSQESGYYPPADYGASGYGGYPYYGTGTGQVYPPTQQPGAYVTNADWATAAESELATTGVSVSDAAAAIARVLAGLPVTVQQQSWFMEAVGLLGSPPPQGYPVPIKLTDTPGQPSGGGTGPTQTPPKSAPSNFSVTGHQAFADFGWHAVSGATSYLLDISGNTRTVHGLNDEHVLLKPGRYSARVRAFNAKGSGPWSSSKTFTVLPTGKPGK